MSKSAQLRASFSLYCNFSVPLSNKTISFLYRQMQVALCYPSVWILYVSGLPTELDQIAVFACPLQAKTGTESPQASGKLSCEIIFSKVKHEGIWTEVLLIRKKNPVFQMTILLHFKLSFFKIPQKWPVFLLHHAQRYFSRVDTREKPPAVQTQIPTVKSGSHQTWSCPQHASRISLFVLQILPCFTHGCKDYSIVLFHSHKYSLFVM